MPAASTIDRRWTLDSRGRWRLPGRMVVAALVLVLAAMIPTAAPAAAAGDEVIQISTGARHACALKSNGTVWCWGFNKQGQLGDGTTITRKRPVRVDLRLSGARNPLDRVVEVVAGRDFTCARRAGDSIWCWGANGFGQLGVGHTGPQPKPLKRVSFGTRKPLTLAAGDSHACATVRMSAIQDDLACWGKGTSGQIGHGKLQDEATPRHAGSFMGGQVAAGSAHTCVRLIGHPAGDGTLRCWGSNAYGQLGTGGPPDPVATPERVRVNVFDAELDAVVQVTAGSHHTCARRSNGRIRCWGLNSSGQLGRGDYVRTIFASTNVKKIDDARDVSAGHTHTCARRSDRTVWCWGSNSDRQLNRGSGVSRKHTPVKVRNLTGVAEVSVNGSSDGGFSCARKTNRTVWCWGSNKRGQLGNGSNAANSKDPVRVKF
ncbi:MAG: hypothetical protein KF809_05845 [Chloroflexi bacterium]|nr:hypothetical protein [Chloroflexota bacterium]